MTARVRPGPGPRSAAASSTLYIEPASHGRTATMKASMASFATNCSTAKFSTRSRKPKSLSSAGAVTTTRCRCTTRFDLHHRRRRPSCPRIRPGLLDGGPPVKPSARPWSGLLNWHPRPEAAVRKNIATSGKQERHLRPKALVKTEGLRKMRV